MNCVVEYFSYGGGGGNNNDSSDDDNTDDGDDNNNDNKNYVDEEDQNTQDWKFNNIFLLMNALLAKKIQFKEENSKLHI